MKHMVGMAAALSLFVIVAPAAAHGEPGKTWRAQGAFAALRVTDVAAMSKWYVEALGFRLIVHDTRRNSALLERHGSVLELIQRSAERGKGAANPAEDLGTSGIIKIGFVVDDFDVLQAALAARKIPVLGRVIVSDADGLRTLAISDTEGNLIQFFGR
jgi:catechol 2,3-dioxygenase-like lactoylglutathione lyase family enzyme